MTHVDEKRHIAKAAGLMSIATFISRILGYVRDMILAFFFGATGLSDTFFVAFRIPNLLRELFAEGSMSAAVIPVLSEYHGRDPVEANRLVRIALTFIFIVVGIVTILGIVFAPFIVSVIAPGFINFPDKFNLTVLLTRIMFPFLLFISLAALVMGALNTKRIFFMPAFAPVMLNIAIIATVFILYRHLGNPIIAVAVGTVIGGFLQFAIQTPAFFKSGYRIRPDYNFRHQGLKKILMLILPATLGMAVSQINIVVSNILASFLSGGSITYLFYSMRLTQFPIGVFGVAMGMAVLPSLSEHARNKEYDKLRDDFSFALRLLFFITVPAMAGLIALREPIVNILFQRGRFDYAATSGTAQALLFYSMGIWAVVGVRVTTASFYSMQDTKTPVKVAIVALTANIILSIILMKPLKHSGLALANALASGVNFALLFFFLRQKLKRIDTWRILHSFTKTAIASFVMGVVGWMLLHGKIWQIHGGTLNKVFYLSGTIAICIMVYISLSYLLKSEEVSYVIEMIKQKLRS
ncbi:MAG: murein biosynthesis integral membrane protein MurJ [Nitrospirae bacterium RBG_13_41_22]|nr:MAG: murein biosynthesis integral membrane protein MurJ [Nitrospirae bacterium RBG_13_41_22]